VADLNFAAPEAAENDLPNIGFPGSNSTGPLVQHCKQMGNSDISEEISPKEIHSSEFRAHK
jgi:hypothetical protein